MEGVPDPILFPLKVFSLQIDSKVRTCLWFPNNGEEAAKFYVSLIPGSRITSSYSPDSDQPPIVIEFTLGDSSFMIINGGSEFKLTPAVSISETTEDQRETDRLWEALIADGGKESMCGWLEDRYGVSWQITPRRLTELLNHSDREAAGRVFNKILEMHKIDISALEEAFQNKNQ